MSRLNLRWSSHEDLAIVKRCCVGREEYLNHMTFKRNDRPMFTEIFGPIIGLKEEWDEQGARPEELDFSAFRYRCERRGAVPVQTGRIVRHPPQLIEETDEHLITRDDIGRTMKLMKGAATIALPLSFPVETMDDWRRIKPLYEWNEARLPPNWEPAAREHLENDRVLTVSIPGGYDETRELMGEVALSIAYYENPELVHDIIATISETVFTAIDRVTKLVPVDLLSVHEDMAGKSGPLIGPTQIEEFVAPYYRRIWDLARDRGARLFDQDSDGNMNPVIDSFVAAGVNMMHPFEPAAGMDVVRTRARYGTRLAFYGGIDKHVIRRSKAEIEAELEYKIPPMVRTGGCVIALDHRIPNGTPLENYRYYVDKAWEIMDRETAKL